MSSAKMGVKLPASGERLRGGRGVGRSVHSSSSQVDGRSAAVPCVSVRNSLVAASKSRLASSERDAALKEALGRVRVLAVVFEEGSVLEDEQVESVPGERRRGGIGGRLEPGSEPPSSDQGVRGRSPSAMQPSRHHQVLC